MWYGHSRENMFRSFDGFALFQHNCIRNGGFGIQCMSLYERMFCSL
jgi:hypothetical protein